MMNLKKSPALPGYAQGKFSQMNGFWQQGFSHSAALNFNLKLR